MPVKTAVTAVLCAEDQVLVVYRAEHLPAFPGYSAFPGGKVEADEQPPPPHPVFCGMPAEQLSALRRELIEEIAVDIHAEAQSGNLWRCQGFGTATTPPSQAYRFATHFFRLDLKRQPPITPDPGELSGARWCAPAEELHAWQRGERLMVPPTRQILSRLDNDFDTDNAGDLEAGHDLELPIIEPLTGLRLLPVPSNTLPPAHNTNAFLIGDAPGERILIDPAPKSSEWRDKLIDVVRPQGIGAVMLTHHHPDHRERADEVARALGVPLWCSRDTRERITAKVGAAYFADIDQRDIGEGDRLCQWLGHDVLAFAVPGHDAGHLAIAPETQHWMIVGDLFQGVGTVVIAPPEGDMATYFRSLQRVIELDPKVVVPSHGIAMGSTFRIRATLEHRQMRENEILELHRDGRSVDEMLPVVYAGINPLLLPLARINIEGHLGKLRDEGRI